MIVLHDQGKRVDQLNPATQEDALCLIESWQGPFALDSPPQQRFKVASVGASGEMFAQTKKVHVSQKMFAQTKKVRASQKMLVRYCYKM
jgi:hypothetical protein